LVAARPRRPSQRVKRAATKKDLTPPPQVKTIYVSYMPCHNCHARTLNWPWVWSMCPEVDNGGLKVEPARGGIFTEKPRLSAYFEGRVDWRALNPVSTQNEGLSQHVIENNGRGICTRDALNFTQREFLGIDRTRCKQMTFRSGSPPGRELPLTTAAKFRRSPIASRRRRPLLQQELA
jgi:hypothetical protein